jgi:Tol biopolymer transport system component
MTTPFTYTVTNSSGATVSSGSIQLGANQSQTISFNGEAGQSYTLNVSNGGQVVLTMGAQCAAQPPGLSATGQCLNGVVTFVVTNNGGAMSSAYTYVVTNSSGATAASGSIQLGAGASQTITFTGQAGQSYTLTVSNGGQVVLTMGAQCASQPPSLSAIGQCLNGVVTFTVNNNGGAMSGQYTYVVTNSTGQTVNSGTIQLGAGASQTITFNGQAGQSYTLTVSNGGQVVLTMGAQCATEAPRLTATGECANGTVTFVVTNNGGTMIGAFTYTVTGNGATVSTGTVQLGAGASQTISFQGAAGVSYTLTVSNGATVVLTMGAQCPAQPPSLTAVGQCNANNGTVSFVVTNNGGAMTSAATYTITNTAGATVGTGTIQLAAGASRTIRIVGQQGQNYTLNISTGATVFVNMSTRCSTLPANLSASGTCSVGLVTYVVNNSGGAMAGAYTYTVTNNLGQVVNTGTIQLGENGSQTITFQGVAGQTYTLNISTGQTVVVTMGTQCTAPSITPTPPPVPPPSLSASGICNNGTVTFVVNNNGGAMTGAYTYTVTNTAGQTVNSGTIQLGAGGSQTISFQGLAGVNYTLRVSNGQTVVITMGASCAQNTGLVCGSTTEGQNGFPIVNTAGCGEDNSRLARPPWTPVSIGGGVCEDWLVYHTNKSGNNRWDVYRLGDGGVAELRGAPENLTRTPEDTESIAPALSPNRRNLSFASNRDGNWEVYIVGVDGRGTPQRVTYNTFAYDSDPVWSPTEGRYLVYESSRRGNLDLFMIDVTVGPSSEVQLTDSAANDMNPYFSPDGKFLYYESVSQGASQIFRIELNGLNAGRPTKVSDGKGADFNPTLSPDGKLIAFRSYRNDTNGGKTGVLFVANADGSAVKQISDSAATATNHAWSPDSKLIAYQSNLQGVMSVYVNELATNITRQATDKKLGQTADAINYAPTWYCKGPTLVFTSDVTGSANLFSIPALPITAPPVKVETEASKLTTGKDKTELHQYPEGSPSEEDASTLGLLPFGSTRR